MHDTAPGPFTATQTVELIGGPYDGETWNVPTHCIELESPDGTGYRYNPYATALFGKTCFTHHTLSYDLHAR